MSSCMRSASWSKARSATSAHQRRARRSLSVISAALPADSRSIARVSTASTAGGHVRAGAGSGLAARKRRRVRRSRYVTQVKRRRGCRRSGARSSSSSTSCRTCTTREVVRDDASEARAGSLGQRVDACSPRTRRRPRSTSPTSRRSSSTLGKRAGASVPRNRRHQEGHDDFMRENDPSPADAGRVPHGCGCAGGALRDRRVHRPRQPGSALGEREAVELLQQNLKQEKEALKKVETISKRLLKASNGTSRSKNGSSRSRKVGSRTRAKAGASR